MGNGLKGLGTTHLTPVTPIMAGPAAMTRTEIIPGAMAKAVTKAPARTTPRTTA
jgi:hypothetical protein